MSDYIKFAREDAELELSKHLRLIGKFFKDKTTGKEFRVVMVRLMPANPQIREKLWRMTNDKTIPESQVNAHAGALQITEFTVCLFSQELTTPSNHPEIRLDELRYVVAAQSGNLELGFAIDFHS